jgi:hypothetical protein
MPTLNDFQLKLLSDAAQHENGLVPIPAQLAAAAKRRIGKLLSTGLVEEVPAKRGAPVWREAEGHRFALHVTAAGLAAIGVDEDEPPRPTRAAPTAEELEARGFVRRRSGTRTGFIIAAPVGPWKPSPPPAGEGTSGAPGGDGDGGSAPLEPASPPPQSKQARVLDLLRRGDGVSLGELIATTGWQAHSVRGFLSGTVKKKLGLTVISEKDVDGERRYRIGNSNPGGSEAN